MFMPHCGRFETPRGGWLDGFDNNGRGVAITAKRAWGGMMSR
jgi:hypothetical protein